MIELCMFNEKLRWNGTERSYMEALASRNVDHSGDVQYTSILLVLVVKCYEIHMFCGAEL